MGQGRFLARVVAVCAISLGAGCAQVTQGSSNDGSCPPDAFCGGGCSGDVDCKTGFHCDPKSHSCVSCVSDGNCPLGQVCGGNHLCGQGCSSGHACGDGGLCELDAGVCVECKSDPDCTDKTRPRCDPATNRCAPCLPKQDNCGHALYCLQQGMAYACAPGCKDDRDCSDGADGGAPPLKCDVTLHKCVNCLKDSECPPGEVCHSGACVSGCTNMQKCPNPLACCAQLCVDTATDFANCGMCGKACSNGWNCCGSACSNPANDVMNCGGCGTLCAVAHGTPTCVLRNCAIAKCNPGWADCDGSYLDGCEINTDSNVGNCGGCNNPCNLPNASPRCVGGTCQVAACALGFADCNNLPKDGCETNIFSSVGSCGGCGVPCVTPHATPKCNLGTCAIALCDPGWLDCNNNPVDGCEIDSTSNIGNCGGCNQVCPSLNGAPSCVNSVCKLACNPGFTNCDGNPQSGCNVNLGNDQVHCGSCQTSCNNLTSHVTGGTCTSGMCTVASCDPGWFDLNLSFADGCECQSDPYGGVCGAASALANVGIGGSTTVTGNLVPANKENWFQVTFTGSHFSKSFHAQVALTTNPNNWFRFDVYSDCNFTALPCAVEGGGPAKALTQWENFWGDQLSGAYNPIPVIGNNNTILIRVYRVAGPITCDNFVLTVSG